MSMFSEMEAFKRDESMASETATAIAKRGYESAYELYCSAAPSGEKEKAFAALMNAEKALLTSPMTTPEDVAMKLEYALAEGLCGDTLAGDVEGLDKAMFQSMIGVLRGQSAKA